MEKRRTIILVILLFLGFMIWNAWEKQFPPAPAVPVPAAIATNASSDNSSSISNNIPAASTTLTGKTPANRQIRIKTDVLNITIDTLGGDVIEAGLPKFPLSTTTPNLPYVLLNDEPNSQYTASSRLVGRLGNTSAQTAPVQYKVQQSSYVLPGSQNVLDVVLTAQDANGVNVTKTFEFTRGSYVINVKYTVNNPTAQTWTGHMVAQLNRTPVVEPSSMFVMATGQYATYSTPAQPYEKMKFTKLNETNLSQNTQAGWVAMTQRYFLSAWIPEETQTSHLYTRANGNNYSIGFAGPELTAPAKGSVTTTARLYVGPEDDAILKTVAPNLNLTLDYGWMWFISMALFWIMSLCYKVVGNWGWAIIFTTIIIKCIFYPLSSKSFRSMAQMRNLQPKLTALKERCGDDRQKIAQGTMELYRKEKVNPLSGCLPMLIQIPVFIALYWVLIDSVQLRQAPFLFWIHDLSVKDPYYILPVIMGITMYFQTHFNPPSPDPTQQKVMKFLPVVFTFFFLHFPSGLVLYWIVNNITQILQQWYVMRKYNRGLAEKAAAHKKKR